MSLSSPAASVAAVLRFLREHLKNHPEQGPAILLSVQSGEFEMKRKVASDTLPDYKSLARLSEEDKSSMVRDWLPTMTMPMWAKVKKATGSDEAAKQIMHQVWYRLTLESSANELPTRSRLLLKELMDMKREQCKTPPALVFTAGFTLDWARNGVYLLGGLQDTDDEPVYTTLTHTSYDVTAT